MNNEANVPRRPGFTQVVVWPGTVVNADQHADFEAQLGEQFDARFQFLECIYTLPDIKDGRAVPGTGGRCDAFFAVHDEDINKFSQLRLGLGMRWVEDVLASEREEASIYPPRVKEYWSWKPDYNHTFPIDYFSDEAATDFRPADFRPRA